MIMLVLLGLFQTVKIYSQAITINTSTYTPTQLATNFFSNSNCNQISNVTSSTGNGVGYFQNSNSNFVLSSGIVISSGNANQIVGSNTTVSSTGSNLSDTDLSNILGATNFVDASYLSYNFVANGSTIGFDFLYASEEYGQYQCSFSDGIAFILTDLVTNTTTNLAIVPGTTVPISTNTIRDIANNSSCPSQNVQYFGGFNSSNSLISFGTNFNGQTVKMVANSTVIPNRAYKLKIVIADRLDSLFDSAIFLGANSFSNGVSNNILGPDLSLCSGNTQYLNTNLNQTDYTFIWKRNGTVISGEISPSLIISQDGSYDVLYTNNVTNCQTTDNIMVEISQAPIINNPPALQVCDDNNDGSACFDLQAAVTFIVNGNLSLVVTFHETQTDAVNGSNPINSTYCTTTFNQIVYVRVINPINPDCFTIAVQELLVNPSPTPIISSNNNLNEIYVDNISGNLIQGLILDSQVTGNYNYQWFLDGVTIAGANNATYTITNYFPIGTVHNYSVSVTNIVTGCFGISGSFVVNAIALPGPIANPNQQFLLGQTLANLVVTGSNILWYNSASRSNTSLPLPNNTALVNNTTYFASQTINGYESTSRTPVTAQLSLANNQFLNKNLQFSPNPIVDILNIKSDEIITNVAIFDILGQVVYNQKFSNLDLKLELSQLNSGNYFAKIETNNGQQIIRIIKK